MSVLCVTPNPAIDRTLTVDHLEPSEVHRVGDVFEAAGGKGLNVARVVAAFGGDPVVMGLLAGASGGRLAALADGESLVSCWTWVDAGETRTCTTVVDGRGSTLLNEPGPAIDADGWSVFAAAVLDQSGELAAANRLDAITISGGLPPGVSPEQLGVLATQLRECGPAQIWVDANGPTLDRALEAGVSVKVNRYEARGIVGDGRPIELAYRLASRSGAIAVVTDGAAGAVAVRGAELFVAHAPPVEVVNATASGDAFLGGLVTALARGDEFVDALALGVATGSANALQLEPGIDVDVVHRLRLDVAVDIAIRGPAQS